MTAVELCSNPMGKDIIGINQGEYYRGNDINNSFSQEESANNSDQ